MLHLDHSVAYTLSMCISCLIGKYRAHAISLKIISSREIVLFIGRGYIHGFRVPNAGSVVASTDSVDRTPELSVRSRIP
jgi:hypothetical protein